MAKKIVYLLGAGSSCYSIPVVNEMPRRMSLFISLLKRKYPQEASQLETLYELVDKIAFYRTPDTLARKLYLSSNSTLQIKNFVSSFLIYEQLEKTSELDGHLTMLLDNGVFSEDDHKTMERIGTTLDNRYLSFFATIFDKLKNQIIMPSNVSIITWNYDIQLERAYQEFRNCSFNGAQSDLNVLPSLEVDDSDYEKIKSEFSILKLNGTAGFYEKGKLNELFDPKVHIANEDSLNILKGLILRNRNQDQNLMNFAWETENEKVVKAREFATEKIANADVLVIIGYSFPDFNRNIDKIIFSNEKLKKIYLQDPDAENIIQKLDGVKAGLRVKTVPRTDTQNFVIPYEFWEESEL